MTVSNGLYRAAAEAGRRPLQPDLDGSVLRGTRPVRTRARDVLTSRFPLDANVNPRDGPHRRERVQLALGYVRDTAWGEWDTRFAAAQSDTDTTRGGFLREDTCRRRRDAITPTAIARTNTTGGSISTPTWSRARLERSTLVWGLDPHVRRRRGGRARTSNTPCPPNGSNAPDLHDLPVDERTRLTDRRTTDAYGGYGSALTEAWRVEAGLRLKPHGGEARGRGGAQRRVRGGRTRQRSLQRHALVGRCSAPASTWRDSEEQYDRGTPATATATNQR